MPSFQGAFKGAEAQMKSLGKTGQAITQQFKRVGDMIKGIGIAAIGAFAAFAAGAVLKKVFGGMQEAATNYLITQEQIGTVIRANHARAKLSAELAEKDTAELGKQADLLGKQGVLGTGVYNQAVKELAIRSQSPAVMEKLLPIMGDVLVATKGVNATSQDMAGFADAVGKALQGGPVKALGQYGVNLEGMTAKTWKAMSAQAKLNWLTKQWGGYAGANAKAAESDLGAIRQMNNAMGGLARTLGLELLPAQAELARFWTEALPIVGPILKSVFGAIGTAVKNLASGLRQTLPYVKEAIEGIIGVFKGTHEINWKWITDGLGKIDWSGAIAGAVSKFGAVFSQGIRNAVQFYQIVGQWIAGVDWGGIGSNVGKFLGDAVRAAITGQINITNTLAEAIGAIDWAAILGNIGKIISGALNLGVAFMDAVAQTDWFAVGASIGNLIASALGSVMDLAGAFANLVATTDWNQVGQQVGSMLGNAISMAIRGLAGIGVALGEFILNTDWGKFAQDMGQLLFDTGPKAVDSFFQGIAQAMQATDWGQAIIGAEQAIMTEIGSWPGKIETALVAVKDGLLRAFQTAFNAVLAAGGAFIQALINKIMGGLAGIEVFGMKPFAGMAPKGGGGGGEAAPAPTQYGGIFRSPVIRQIAEAGTPEAVIPLERSARSEGLLSTAANALGLGLGQPGAQIGPTSMSFAPVINVAGNMTGTERTAIDQQLRRLADDFLKQFTQFQERERRLAYE